MDLAERTSLVDQLRASRDALLEVVASVSDTQAKFKPAPDAWSIEDVVEHLAAAEHGMFRLITVHYELLDAPTERTREEMLAERGRDRQNRLQAPERVRPRGRYGSLSSALGQFQQNRERTIAYIAECQDDLRRRATEHLMGRISCQECLMILIAHPFRHAGQIREIKRSARYPA
jgi:uncharacterized damage-inducible protein DinB